MSPLALVRLSTEFSHHICIGPSPKKKSTKYCFQNISDLLQMEEVTYTLSGISGRLSNSGNQF